MNTEISLKFTILLLVVTHTTPGKLNSTVCNLQSQVLDSTHCHGVQYERVVRANLSVR